MDNLAPIALFVHARLDHTKKTVKSLLKNPLAKASKIYIFSDSYRVGRKGEVEEVEKVREYIKSIEGFDSIKIVLRKSNYGLKRNIVEGLNHVLEEHDRVIVLEDDCVTSPEFLEFMNSNLALYENSKNNNVWHISAWNPGVNFDDKAFPSYYMSCWGWATWRYRWENVCFDPLELMESMSLTQRYRFNLKGRYPFYSHLLGNYLGLNNTWAIFWYATIFTSQGHCINPPRSLITNLGMDGSGTHKAICFDQNANNVNFKSYNNQLAILDETLDALSDVFNTQQSKVQYIYSLIKMLTPIWTLKLMKKIKG
jgi:hypothetical protein